MHARSFDNPAGEFKLLQLLCSSRAQILHYVARQIPSDLSRLIEPEDIFQGVCCRASTQLDLSPIPHDSDSALRWILSVTRNFLVDRVRELRAQKRGSAISEEELRHGSVVAMLQDLIVYHRTPSTSAAAREFLALVEQALQNLPPDQQSAVRFRHMENLSESETAARMGCSERWVRKLSERGLAAMRTQLRTASMYV